MKKRLKILLFDTYLSVIQGSVGSSMFLHSYARSGKGKRNILENGNLSCAFYTSSILSMFNLVDTQHATVSGLIKDLKKNGWKEISRPRKGAVLLWEKMVQAGGELHEHTGFYIGNKKAISHRFEKKLPIIHHYKFGSKNRKIKSIYWHKKLDKK